MRFRATIMGFLLGCLGAALLMLATPAQLEMISDFLREPATGQPLLGLDVVATKYLLMALSITLLPLAALALASLFRTAPKDDSDLIDEDSPVHRFSSFSEGFADPLVPVKTEDALESDVAASAPSAPVIAPAAEIKSAPAPADTSIPSANQQITDLQNMFESRIFAIAEHMDQLMAVAQKNREDIAQLIRHINAQPATHNQALESVAATLHQVQQRLEALEKIQQPLLARSEKMEVLVSQLAQSRRDPQPAAYTAAPMKPVPAMSAPPSLTDPATAERLALALEQLRRVTDGSGNNN